jgi:hypothetical protein
MGITVWRSRLPSSRLRMHYAYSISDNAANRHELTTTFWMQGFNNFLVYIRPKVNNWKKMREKRKTQSGSGAGSGASNVSISVPGSNSSNRQSLWRPKSETQLAGSSRFASMRSSIRSMSFYGRSNSNLSENNSSQRWNWRRADSGDSLANSQDDFEASFRSNDGTRDGNSSSDGKRGPGALKGPTRSSSERNLSSGTGSNLRKQFSGGGRSSSMENLSGDFALQRPPQNTPTVPPEESSIDPSVLIAQDDRPEEEDLEQASEIEACKPSALHDVQETIQEHEEEHDEDESEQCYI